MSAIVKSLERSPRAHLHVGDAIEVEGPDGTLTLTLVGEVFDNGSEGGQEGLVIRGAFSDLEAVDSEAVLDRWEIQPAAGTTAND